MLNFMGFLLLWFEIHDWEKRLRVGVRNRVCPEGLITVLPTPPPIVASGV
jgi:hypothetical protein